MQLEHAFRSEAADLASGNDQVIKQLDPEGNEGTRQGPCNLAISFARGVVSRRVVVRENQSRSAHDQGMLNNGSNAEVHLINLATFYQFVDQAVAAVEEQDV